MHVCLCDKGRCCLGRIIKKKGGGDSAQKCVSGNLHAHKCPKT